MSINIPDRPGSMNFLTIHIEDMNVSNSINYKAKRILLKPDQKIYVQTYKVMCDKVQMLFGETQIPITSSPFNVKVLFESPMQSSILDRADPHLVEKASHLSFDFEPMEIVLH